MCVLLLALCKVRDGMVSAPENPLGRQQTLDSHWPPGVQARRADADLGAETESEPVGESRACVVEHTRAVHLVEERFGGSLVLRHDNLCVRAAPLVDVLDGILHAVHELHGASEITISKQARCVRGKACVRKDLSS